MHKKEKVHIKNPIVWIFVALITASISYEIYEEYRELTIIIVALFLIMILFLYDIYFAAVIMVVMLCGITINYAYYSNLSQNAKDVVRIKQINSYNVIAQYKGRNVILDIDNEDICVEDRYYVEGKLDFSHYSTYGIVGELKVNNYKAVPDDLRSKLFEIKSNTFTKLQNNIGRRKAALITSIALGYKDYLDEEDKNAMRSWGIIHTISVSGLHVMLIYSFLKKSRKRIFAILGTFLYVLLTGAVYSSVRAFIMLCSVEGAKIVKRNNNSLSAISLSGIIIFLSAPYALFQLSFQLSYLATLGIILFNKKIEKKLYKIISIIREPLSITLSAQILTLPVLMMQFGEVSLNFILGNLIMVPVINILVIVGNLSMLCYKFNLIFDFISFIVLHIINLLDNIMNVCENFSLFSLYCNKYTVMIYCIILFSFYFTKKGYNKFLYLPIISLFIIMLQIYSPVLKLEYYNEGAVLISYKGNRILYVLNNKSNIELLQGISCADKIYRNNEKVIIKDLCMINNNSDGLILKNDNKKYLLFSSNRHKDFKEYDIINFKENKFNTLYVFNDSEKTIVKGYI